MATIDELLFESGATADAREYIEKLLHFYYYTHFCSVFLRCTTFVSHFEDLIARLWLPPQMLPCFVQQFFRDATLIAQSIGVLKCELDRLRPCDVLSPDDTPAYALHGVREWEVLVFPQFGMIHASGEGASSQAKLHIALDKKRGSEPFSSNPLFLLSTNLEARLYGHSLST
jgi:hypothetical protein